MATPASATRTLFGRVPAAAVAPSTHVGGTISIHDDAPVSAPFLWSRTSLGDDYGDDDTARELAATLDLLADAGFPKATALAYSVFERLLGGLCWLLQRLVKREDAARGRVQWELLFQPHDKMKPRLGLAQDVVTRLDALPVARSLRLQPHQLLLQDGGDVSAVRRLVAWLVAQPHDHLETIRTTRGYQNVVHQTLPIKTEPPKREVVYVQRAYQPRRMYQYTSTTNDDKETEDALVQKCLLEYGERVAAATIVDADSPTAQDTDTDALVDAGDARVSLMAQLAAAAVSKRNERSSSATEGGSQTQKTKATTKSKDTREFEAQYQRIVQQAMVEQTALLEKQRAREAELLRQVVSVPELPSTEGEKDVNGSELSEEVKAEESKLRDEQLRLVALEDTKQRLRDQREQLEAEQLVLDGAMLELEAEKKQLDADELANVEAQPYLSKLRGLVAKNEALKKQKSEFKTKCKTELEGLQARVAQLRLQTEAEAAQQDEETLRLKEIEQMHVQMAAKHKDLRVALARHTRELQKRMKQIDDVPTRIELIQYEKRFLELYDEVALTLDETRKYYTVYNTLKTTHEFLEKEISLINSMHDNFDVAMGSKPATQAFFSQLDAITQNVETSVRKQQSLRADHQVRVETLDSKYQLLLEKERMYVNAIREFQKECEKNEKLSAKLAQHQRHVEQTAAVPEAVVASGDVVL